MHRAGRRVAITGFGVVAPCGLGKSAFWTGLLGPATTGVQSLEILDWEASSYYPSPKHARRADMAEQFAMASMIEAFDQSGRPDVDPRRFGVVFGTGIGGLRTLEQQVELRLSEGDRRVSPFLVPMMMGNVSAAAISIRYGMQGPNETISTACASATHAIGQAARLIAWGRCDAMVTGGTESAGTLTNLAGFTNMRALSTSARSMPFDVDRDGFVMGEGAATLILEAWDTAIGRGARILGEVLGAASTSDAHHITAPSPDGNGATYCMHLALQDSSLTPADIRQINAHGTSTPLNDAAEAKAIEAVFGADTVPVTSIKGVTGHPLGAAGALEAVAVLLSMEHGLIPPTAGTSRIADGMRIDLVIGEPRPWQPGPTMSNSFGFGGHNGSLIIGAPPDSANV